MALLTSNHVGRWCALFALLSLSAALAAPLPPSSVPEPLKPWVPWVMHGAEMLACPTPFNDPATHTCVWPSQLEVNAGPNRASFRYEVRVFGAESAVELPGQTEHWPQDIKANGQAVPVSQRDGRPVARLSPGQYVITGAIAWAEMPQGLLMPTATGSVRVWVDGMRINRTPDRQGRLWLKQSATQEHITDTVVVRTARLVDDQIPLQVTTHYELAVAGKPRQLQLDFALLPGFVPVSMRSALPARLQDDGKLELQARAGNWTVEVRGRMMSPPQALSLPTAAARDETWSVSAHNELRVISVDGVVQIDPQQVEIPDAWKQYPAYRVRAGDTMAMTQTKRGNPTPNPDKLSIAREIWLDFDGGGYTVHDAITGHLSRSWRLELARPGELGRASVGGDDQPITRLSQDGPFGIEVRQGRADIRADSRVNTSARTFSASGWRVDFEQASAVLHLPPGWRLLHASNVDAASGAWVSQWTLWDFFFVLLSALAAGKLIGWRTGVLLGLALAASWHMPGAPQALWLALLALLTLTKVLPAGRLLSLSTWGARAGAVLIALVLLPYGVEQVRLSMYPALERPWQALGGPGKRSASHELPGVRPIDSRARKAEEAAIPLDETVAVAGESESSPAQSPSLQGYARGVVAATSSLAGKSSTGSKLDDVDPQVRVQTGPGLPHWRWNSHRLTWQGPAQASQQFTVMLLPPTGTVLLRLGSFALMIAALLAIVALLPKASWRLGGVTASAALCLLALLGTHEEVAARESAPQSLVVPPQEIFDELRAKLSAAPDCMPACADVSRMLVIAQDSRIQLRLEVHAQADVAVPLPGRGTNWRPSVVTVDDLPAVLRRDEADVLWVSIRAGIHQIVLDSDVGDVSRVEIALPMPLRELKSQITGWTLAGLDARGLASGALSLSRAMTQRDTESSGTQRDALPPFLRVERTLHLGKRWTIATHVRRIAPSRAPAQSKIKLIDGEAVNDASVRVQDGHAIVQLGTEDAAAFVSTLKEAPKFQWQSTREPNQVEVWKLDASTQWHVGLSGIPPVLHQLGQRWMPTWRPWPGESVSIAVSKPLGVSGQTMTVDRVSTGVVPGQRATDVSTNISLRSSQGGNHRLELPEGAELMAVSINEQVQPIQPQGRSITLPITPGAHQIALDWREARGMNWWFETHLANVGAPGVNNAISIQVPQDRVVLATRGPVIGPAVLFWGVLIPVFGIAVALGRSRVAPLSIAAWFLLGLGIAQTTLWGAVAVAAWFVLLGVRKRVGEGLRDRAFIAMQLGLVVWTLVVAIVLLNTVRTGLLGYPDMMISGNGSDAWNLHWYQDRLSGETVKAWVLTAPVLAYRAAMLLWALWLAASLLKWIKWAWDCFSQGGYWRTKPPSQPAQTVPAEHDQSAS
ncbi:MAG: hypothetical protein OEM00_04425 [Burkholderiaceae bacterium]|nr:hypothetical protein [Burkholderiaceae bacterium]